METTLSSKPVHTARLLLLSLTAIAVTLTAVELVLRVGAINVHSVYDRVLFYTFPAFVDDGLGSVRYAPNSEIREVAVFGEQIDYDRRHRSNNLGFLDNIDYEPAEAGVYGVVFVGDSFTAGTGGYPWVPELRKRVHNGQSTRIYNLGVGSASIYHMDKLLASFKHEVGYSEVNVLLITDDFFRPFWRPVQHDNTLWFCPTEGETVDCSALRRPIIHQLSITDNADRLRAAAQEIYMAGRYPMYYTPSWLQQLRLYRIACDAYHRIRPNQANVIACPHLYYQHYRDYQKNQKYFQAMSVVQGWPAKFPDVKFRLFHIPEKSEVVVGKYTLDIANELRATNIDFVPLLKTCDWTVDLYYEHDTHLTPDGYRHLRDCVAQHLSYLDTEPAEHRLH